MTKVKDIKLVKVKDIPHAEDVVVHVKKAEEQSKKSHRSNFRYSFVCHRFFWK